jgi:hypothetical protein
MGRLLFVCNDSLIISNVNAAAGKAAQKRSRLLFHGLIRLWLRNSGFALRQSRHGRLISSHGMTQTLTTFCFSLSRRNRYVLYSVKLAGKL